MSRPPNTETRERMLDTAYELIYKHGFKGASMDDIAEACGVKKANLFHYFPTKETLGLAVFEHAIRGFQARWAAKLNQDKTPLQVVGALFDDTRRGMQRCHCLGGCFIGNLAQELSDTHETIRQKVADHLRSWQRQLTTYFARQQASGYFRKDFDPKAGAQSLIALYEGALLMAKATRDPQALASAKKLALDGLSAARK